MKFYFFRFLSLLFLLVECNQNISSQDTIHWGVSAGIGFYEAFHMGIEHNYRPNLGYEISLGSQFWTVHNHKYYDLTFQHNWTFRKNKVLTSWSLDNKLVFWYLEDKYYKWFVLSMEPALGKNFKITKKLDIHLDAGPVFMVVLYFKRKTFEEVGWPRYFLGNATLKIVYKL